MHEPRKPCLAANKCASISREHFVWSSSPLPLQEDVCHPHDLCAAWPASRILRPALRDEPSHRVWTARIHGRPLPLDGHLNNDLQPGGSNNVSKTLSASFFPVSSHILLPMTCAALWGSACLTLPLMCNEQAAWLRPWSVQIQFATNVIAFFGFPLGLLLRLRAFGAYLVEIGCAIPRPSPSQAFVQNAAQGIDIHFLV